MFLVYFYSSQELCLYIRYNALCISYYVVRDYNCLKVIHTYAHIHIYMDKDEKENRRINRFIRDGIMVAFFLILKICVFESDLLN